MSSATHDGPKFQPENNNRAEAIKKQQMEVLERANKFGITTIRQLRHEATVEQIQFSTPRMIDREDCLSNLEFWAVLLDFRQTTHNDAAREIFWALVARARRWNCVVDITKADHLWEAFVALGVRDTNFMNQMLRHMFGGLVKRPSLWSDVVDACLQSPRPEMAKEWAAFMRNSIAVEIGDMLRLLSAALSRGSQTDLQKFMSVYGGFAPMRLHGLAMGQVCEMNNVELALSLHKSLIDVGDVPATFADLKALLALMARHHIPLDDFLRRLDTYGLSYTSQARRFYSDQVGFESVRGMIDEATNKMHGVTKQRISDHFIARTFATAAFPFYFVVNGLQLAGVQSLGPQSLRELALHATDIPHLKERLSMLYDIGIDLGASVYARLLHHIVLQKDAVLFTDLMANDQHPDNFDDASLQERVFTTAYWDKDWAAANVAGTALTIHKGFKMRPAAIVLHQDPDIANILLRSLLRRSLGNSDRVLIAKFVEQMAVNRLPVSISTIGMMITRLLPERSPGSMPIVNRKFDDLSFLVHLLQQCMSSTTEMLHRSWWEIFRRLGKSGRWRNVERLALRLAHIHARRAAPKTADSNTSLYDVVPRTSKSVYSSSTHPTDGALAALFSPALQGVLVEWAFIHGNAAYKISAHHLGPLKLEALVGSVENRLGGLKLLRRLAEDYNIMLDSDVIRRKLIHRLRTLFSVGGYSTVAYNRRARARNSTSLTHLLEQIKSVYGGDLFSDVEAAKKEIYHTPPLKSFLQKRKILQRAHHRWHVGQGRIKLARVRSQQVLVHTPSNRAPIRIPKLKPSMPSMMSATANDSQYGFAASQSPGEQEDLWDENFFKASRSFRRMEDEEIARQEADDCLRASDESKQDDTSASGEETAEEDVVGYSDLFTPSWKEHEKMKEAKSAKRTWTPFRS